MLTSSSTSLPLTRKLLANSRWPLIEMVPGIQVSGRSKRGRAHILHGLGRYRSGRRNSRLQREQSVKLLPLSGTAVIRDAGNHFAHLRTRGLD
jgi:hypothetical protein